MKENEKQLHKIDINRQTIGEVRYDGSAWYALEIRKQRYTQWDLWFDWKNESTEIDEQKCLMFNAVSIQSFEKKWGESKQSGNDFIEMQLDYISYVSFSSSRLHNQRIIIFCEADQALGRFGSSLIVRRASGINFVSISICMERLSARVYQIGSIRIWVKSKKLASRINLLLI